MTAHATTAIGGGTSGTGNRTLAVTPAVGNLLVVAVFAANNAQTAPTVTDDQGGTYYQVPGSAQRSIGGVTCTLTLHVRNHPVEAAVSHTVTAATGANDAAEIAIEACSGSHRFGSLAVKSYGFGSGASGVAPTATHNATPITTNMCLFFVGSGDTTTSAPTGYTERGDASQSTPTTALEIATIDSGNTTAAIASTATASTDWTCAVLELDASAFTFAGAYPTSAAQMATAVGYGTWTSGYLFHEASGNPAPTFGTGTLTAGGSPSYSNAGMISGETAIGIDDFDTLSGGDINDPGFDDLVLCLVFNLKTRDSSSNTIVLSKGTGTSHYILRDVFAASLEFTISDGTSSVTRTISYSGSNEWIVLLAVVDRTNNRQRLALYAPSAGYLKSTEGTTSFANSVGNASGFNLHNNVSFWSYSTWVDALYVGIGAGAAASLNANTLGAIYNFMTSRVLVVPNVFRVVGSPIVKRYPGALGSRIVRYFGMPSIGSGTGAPPPPAVFDALVAPVTSPTPYNTAIPFSVNMLASGVAQTSGSVRVSLSGVTLSGVVTNGLDGWSETGWSLTSGEWHNTLTRAAVAIGTTTPTFTATPATDVTGTLTITTNYGGSNNPNTTQDSGDGNSRAVVIVGPALQEFVQWSPSTVPAPVSYATTLSAGVIVQNVAQANVSFTVSISALGTGGAMGVSDTTLIGCTNVTGWVLGGGVWSATFNATSSPLAAGQGIQVDAAVSLSEIAASDGSDQLAECDATSTTATGPGASATLTVNPL